MKFLCNTLERKIYVTDFQDMSSYGSTVMGLLGMKIEKNLKDISKYKKKYKIYHPDKKKFPQSYSEVEESFKKFLFINFYKVPFEQFLSFHCIMI